jgi:hypothetical protein
MSLNSMSSLFHRKSSDASDGKPAATSPTTCTPPIEASSLVLIEERLGSLCESISKGVLPGLERELSTVRFDRG